jgi:Arc/MetJ family transcription regulator
MKQSRKPSAERTNIVLDSKLVERVKRLAKVKTTHDAVDVALEHYVPVGIGCLANCQRSSHPIPDRLREVRRTCTRDVDGRASLHDDAAYNASAGSPLKHLCDFLGDFTADEIALSSDSKARC